MTRAFVTLIVLGCAVVAVFVIRVPPQASRARGLRAFRAGIATTPGLGTTVRPARHAERTLGPLGWALLGGAGGLWLGAMLAIVVAARSRGRACARGRRDRGR